MDFFTTNLPRVAIGFDAKRNIYKVVRIFRCLNEAYRPRVMGRRLDEADDISSHYVEGPVGMRCEVYTLGGTGGGRGSQQCSWKSIGKAPISEHLQLSCKDRPVVVNGAIHWLYRYVSCKLGPKVALSFSLTDETFDVIHHPDGRLRPRTSQLAELGGWLCVCDTHVSERSHMDIWMLKDYEGRQWVKQYIVDLTKMHNLAPYLVFSVWPVMIVDGKMVLCDGKSRMEYYDIERETFFHERHFVSDDRHDVPYIGSLIWPRA